MDKAEIDARFESHVPGVQGSLNIAEVRRWGAMMAEELNALCPDGREKSTALTKLEEVVFWANAAIARHGTTT